MTITEQKAFLQQYTGKAQAPAGFAQAWAETVAALQPEVQLAPVPFANPCGVYEQLTVTYPGRTVTARVIRPAAAGRHPARLPLLLPVLPPAAKLPAQTLTHWPHRTWQT